MDHSWVAISPSWVRRRLTGKIPKNRHTMEAGKLGEVMLMVVNLNNQLSKKKVQGFAFVYLWCQ
jgi:hypothetical protein